MPAFLTQQEAADLLRVSLSTIQRWKSDGRLPFQKLGTNGIRFRREHVEALVIEGTPTPAGKSWTVVKVTRDSAELPASAIRSTGRRAA